MPAYHSRGPRFDSRTGHLLRDELGRQEPHFGLIAKNIKFGTYTPAFNDLPPLTLKLT